MSRLNNSGWMPKPRGWFITPRRIKVLTEVAPDHKGERHEVERNSYTMWDADETPLFEIVPCDGGRYQILRPDGSLISPRLFESVRSARNYAIELLAPPETLIQPEFPIEITTPNEWRPERWRIYGVRAISVEVVTLGLGDPAKSTEMRMCYCIREYRKGPAIAGMLPVGRHKYQLIAPWMKVSSRVMLLREARDLVVREGLHRANREAREARKDHEQPEKQVEVPAGPQAGSGDATQLSVLKDLYAERGKTIRGLAEAVAIIDERLAEIEARKRELAVEISGLINEASMLTSGKAGLLALRRGGR